MYLYKCYKFCIQEWLQRLQFSNVPDVQNSLWVKALRDTAFFFKNLRRQRVFFSFVNYFLMQCV